jgi:hypothetical protein
VLVLVEVATAPLNNVRTTLGGQNRFSTIVDRERRVQEKNFCLLANCGRRVSLRKKQGLRE